MKFILSTLFVAMLSFWGTHAIAEPALIGEMHKLVVHERDQLMPELIMNSVDDKRYFLSDYRDKILLVNIWATWCPPCVAELASLDALEVEMGGDDFKVLAISVDENMTPNDIQAFLNEEGMRFLEPLLDHEGTVNEIPKLVGLPTSFIVNGIGNTIATYEGDANWSSPEAKDVIQYFIDQKNNNE